MPVVDRSNNRILPANSRAVDVAQKTLQEIIPVQQRRYHNAFMVQGFEAIHYSHLLQGRKCSCQASRRQLNSRLGEDGKASAGLIDQLITGERVFDVTPYGQDNWVNTDDPNATSPLAPVNQHQGVFDVRGYQEDYPVSHIVDGDDDISTFGDNGPVSRETLDDLVGDFDSGIQGMSDVACGVCFGTGFLGGYAPYHANRIIVPCNDATMPGSRINNLVRPWTATGPSFSVQVVLPKGAIGVDVLRVWNNYKPVNAKFIIDDRVIITRLSDLVALCDGLSHKISVQFSDDTTWTHLELQLVMTTESVYFEFPKLQKSSDTSMLERLEPFQIVLSPNVPRVDAMDVIVESTLGKHLVVQNCNPWNTRNRNVLGWECTVRVIQPQELYRILPQRGVVATKDQTTQMVRDNVSGPRRT